MANVSSTTVDFDERRATIPGCDLGLSIEGSPLGILVNQVRGELRSRGLGVVPRFYISLEWGVAKRSLDVAIPVRLLVQSLSDLLRGRVGFVEGTPGVDVLKYLRHEVGHVVAHAYQLPQRPDWSAVFAAESPPDLEPGERASPRCHQFVCHLPGAYAQRDPEEDWAETFAVWLTPGRDWRREYAPWRAALRKLEYCAWVMNSLRGADVPLPA